MRNPLEEGRQRLTEQEEIQESYREIFTTAINVLETKGQPEKGFPFPFLKHQYFRHTMGSPDPEVRVKIIAGGKDLEKVKEVFVFINGVSGGSWLGVRKAGIKGQEEFKGRGSRTGDSALGPKLDGSRNNHITFVREYLGVIKQIRSEIMPH